MLVYFLAPLIIRLLKFCTAWILLIPVRLGSIAPDVRAIIWFAEDRLKHSLLVTMMMISRLWWTLCEASHQLSWICICEKVQGHFMVSAMQLCLWIHNILMQFFQQKKDGLLKNRWRANAQNNSLIISSRWKFNPYQRVSYLNLLKCFASSLTLHHIFFQNSTFIHFKKLTVT